MHPLLLSLARFSRKLSGQYFFIACVAVVLAGCVVKRSKYDVPVVPLPDKYSQSPFAITPDETQAAESPANALGYSALKRKKIEPELPVTPLADVMANWWRLLNSTELNDLMDRALANNQDLHIAAYRIAEAKARADQASSGRFPTVSLPLAVSNTAPYNGIGTVPPGQKVTNQVLYEASVLGEMRADLWGERQSLYESSDFQLWSTTFLRDDVQRTLVANVVSSYVNYLSLNDRIRVAHETESVLSGMENAALERMKGGDATIIDVEQMRAEVNSVRATIPILELQRDQTIDSLALLAGSVPGMLTLSDKGLDSLSYPAVLPGMPSSLLLRRPDVRAIEAQMIAADANIDVARSEVLPPLDLTLQVGTGASALSQLFKPNTIFWNAIANMSATIFDDGKLSNEVTYARSVHEEMVESYTRVVYRAVRDVEDSLAAIRKITDQLKAEEASVGSAHKAWDYSAEAYSAGAVDYLVLLDTERTYHGKLDEMHSVRRDRYVALANLFLALGGGVQQGDAIPGKGMRPTPDDANSGVVLEAAPESVSMDGIDFEAKAQQNRDKKEVWLVELPAIYDSALIGSAWRDLQARFPQLIVNHRLWPRRQGRVADGDKNRAEWYRLYVAEFVKSKEAEDFCNKLTGMRCHVVSSTSSDFLSGVAVAPKSGKKPEPKTNTPGTLKSKIKSPANKAMALIQPAKPNIAVKAAPAQAVLAPITAPVSAPKVYVKEESGNPPSGKANAPKWIRGNNAAIPSAVSETKLVATSEKAPAMTSERMPAASREHAVRYGYAVQLGTYGSLSEAAKAAAVWKARGYLPYVYQPKAVKGHSGFTVRVGKFSGHADASALAESIRKQTRVKAIPVPVRLDEGNFGTEAPKSDSALRGRK